MEYHRRLDTHTSIRTYSNKKTYISIAKDFTIIANFFQQNIERLGSTRLKENDLRTSVVTSRFTE